MRKHKIHTIFIFVIIFLLSFIVIQYKNYHNSEQKIHKIAGESMEYIEFKQLSSENLSYIMDGISFGGVEQNYFFQTMLKDPYSFLPLVMQLIQDQSVEVSQKTAAAAAMLDMDILDIAKLVDFINTESQKAKYSDGEKRNLALIADYIAFNYPKGLSLTDWDAVGKQNLSDHYKREEVYQVFKNMYENPYFDESYKKQGGIISNSG